MTREQAKKLKKILNETVELSDGSMAFAKHFKSDDGSREGWYSIG